MYRALYEAVSQIKKTKPLILNITNFVTMDFIANGLLSLGASPVMSNAEEEIEDLLQLASVVVINLGTLDDKFISLCKHTCAIANELGKPIILDPVGAGASKYRTRIYRELLENYHFDFVRGDASEIMALTDAKTSTKGVDSTVATDHAINSAKAIASQHAFTVLMSGEIDIVVDENKIARFTHGSCLMPMITGTGCLLSAVLGAFRAVVSDRFDAATFAAVFYGTCGEIAAESARTPGAYRSRFLDVLHMFPERTRYAS